MPGVDCPAAITKCAICLRWDLGLFAHPSSPMTLFPSPRSPKSRASNSFARARYSSQRPSISSSMHSPSPPYTSCSTPSRGRLHPSSTYARGLYNCAHALRRRAGGAHAIQLLANDYPQPSGSRLWQPPILADTLLRQCRHQAYSHAIGTSIVQQV